jgi:hypothetical protein
MALTPEELKKQNDLIKEGIELAKKLGLAAEEASLKNFKGDLVQAERLVQSLRDEWKEYTKDIAGAREGFARILDEIKGINSGVTRSRNAFSGLTSLAAKLQNHVDGTNRLSTKELEKLKQQTKQREDDLKLAGKLSKDRINELKAKAELSTKEKKELREAKIAHQNISQEITRNAGHLRQFNAQLSEAVSESEKIDKNLGLAGKLIGDIGKLPIVGSFIDSAKVLEDATAAAGEEGATKASTMKAAFKSAGSSLKTNLMDPTAITLGLIKMLWSTLVEGDKATGDLAKSMNMTYDAASKTRFDLNRIANSTFDASVNTKRLQESMIAVGNALGTNAQLNEKDLVTMTKLRDKAGLTNEELVSMEKLTLATGGNLEDNTKEFLGGAKALAMEKGLAINVKQLMQETSKASNATKLSIAGGAKGLAEAAVQAKALGINLEKADNIAESLLNFEDSISAELEAELLTGKQINLEAARLAALNGDIGKMAEEINEQVGGSAEFSKMNRIQQESYAKAVGMSREELASALIEQEALAAIGRDLNKEEQAAYEAAKKKYGEKEAAKMLAEGELDNMMHQQSIQDRINDSIEKMKEILVTIAQPILQIVSPLVDLLQNVLMPINMVLGYIQETFGKIGTAISKAIGPLGTFGKILKGIAGLAVVVAAYKTYAAISTALMATVYGGITAPVVGGLAAAAITAAGFGLLNSIKDGAVDPNGGLVISKPEGGVLAPIAQGIPGDYAYLTTNGPEQTQDATITPENKGAIKPPMNSSNNEGGGNNSGMVAELVAIKNLLQQIASTPGKVIIDGNEAGRVLAPLINQTNLQTQVKTQ